jgi:protoporphyrinogen oxidase
MREGLSLHETGTFDYVILGGGVAGMSAASVLGDRCVVLERASRPGGLVRSESVGGYWFDRVLHLLHFQDTDTEELVKPLLAEELACCPPEAWVETSAGVTRYPFQMNLGALDPSTVFECLSDLAAVRRELPPAHLEESLLNTFGSTMCDLFMLPYNRKLWQRPLDTLEPDVAWTVARPAFGDVLRGAVSPGKEFTPYNARGWYPRPGAGASPRGMERLSLALADTVRDLRTGHEATAVDPGTRSVVSVRTETGREEVFGYRLGLVSTIPLPDLIGMIAGCPSRLTGLAAGLSWNRVYSVILAVRGPRPEDCGLWRYYADETLCFTRLVFMHSFDPLSAPPDGWGLLAEIPESAELPARDGDDIYGLAIADLERSGAIPPGSVTEGWRVLVTDPAYVAFTHGTRAAVEELTGFLARMDIHPLGRYGRWEYSSMAQVIRDGFELGGRLSAPARTPAASGDGPGR